MLPPIANQVIQIDTPETKVVHGAVVADWSKPPVGSRTVTGCSVQPAGGSEDRQHRDQLSGRMRLFAPPGVAVGALDRVHVPGYPGQHWRVTGQAQQWSPGFLDHVQYDLATWEG